MQQLPHPQQHQLHLIEISDSMLSRFTSRTAGITTYYSLANRESIQWSR